MQKVVGYTRVSTSQQSAEGVSLANQESLMRKWAKDQGYDLLDVFTDAGLSGGGMAKRPALKQALDAAKKERAILCVYALSRLSRNTIDCLTIAEDLVGHGSGLISLTEANINLKDPSGLLVYRLLSAISEGERDTLRFRVKSAMGYMRRQNCLIGSVPFGMDLQTDGKTLKPNAREQKTLKTMLELRGQGKSLNEIVAALKAKGSKTKQGKEWRAETVRRILARNQPQSQPQAA